MIGHLLIPRPPIQVMPELAEAVGLNEAIVIQITHFWLDPQSISHFFDGRYWVENLVQNLTGSFFFWDDATITYLVASLEQRGLLVSHEGKAVDGSPALYHTINYHHLEKMVPADAGPLLSHGESEDLPEFPEFSEANANLRPAFQAHIEKKSENLHVMVVTDERHCLKGEFSLEIQEKSSVKNGEFCALECVCHFPTISVRKFRQLLGKDESLRGALMIVFHLKILDRLLEFCRIHHTDRLVIYLDHPEDTDLEIYHAFLGEVSHLPAFEIEEAEIVIPVSCEALFAWENFRKQVNLKLRQGLWQKQKTSAAIRRYLKCNGWPEM